METTGEGGDLILTGVLAFCRDAGVIDGFQWSDRRITICRGRYSYQVDEREAIPFLRGFLRYEVAAGRWVEWSERLARPDVVDSRT